MTFNTSALEQGYKTVYRVCLGVYHCSQCNLKQPLLQTIKESRNILSKRPKTKCPKHGDIKYTLCNSRYQITELLTGLKVKYVGTYNHCYPL